MRILKHIVTSVAFVLGLAVLLVATSYIFTPKNNAKNFGMDNALANGILGEATDTVDVLILGDSEAYSDFTPMQIWDDYGIPVYVCATSAQLLYLTETFLHRAFSNQTPKVVLLETNTMFRQMNVQSAVKNKAANVFSVFRYHNRWKSMHISEIGKKVQYTWTDDNKGYVYNTDCKPAPNKDYMIPGDGTEEIPDFNIRYLESIADYCKEKGVPLILVSAPSARNWNYSRHNSVAAFAKEHELEYIDMNLLNDEIRIDWDTDTRDEGDHLNYKGAVKASRYLGKYLYETYSLTNRKNDAAYVKWNEALQRYKTVTGLIDK